MRSFRIIAPHLNRLQIYANPDPRHMSSNKTNSLAATALLLLSPLTTNYCGAETPPLNPKLVSVYKRMVAFEDAIPKPDRPNETWEDRYLEVVSYASGGTKLLSDLENELLHLLPDVRSINPETIKKRREIVFSLQRQYGAAWYSIILMLPDPRAPFQYTKNAGDEEEKYVRRHPSLRFTKLVAFYLLPYPYHRRNLPM